MKQVLIFLAVSFLATNAFSQDYMDKIIQETCDCTDKIDMASDPDQGVVELGLCMINAAMPYKKKLKKDYDIDLDNITDGSVGEKLGEIVGLKMAAACPESLMKIVEASGALEEEVEEEYEESVRGTITKIENDNFVVFSLKDNTGKVTKYHWLTYIDSDVEVATDYNKLLGKPVRITYLSQEFFDPKTEGYRLFNVLIKIETIGS